MKTLPEPRKIYAAAKRGRKIEIAHNSLERIREQLDEEAIDPETGKALAYLVMTSLLRSLGLGILVTEYERIKTL